MVNKPLSELSIEELEQKKKSVLLLTSILGAALLVLFVTNTFLAFKKGFSASSVVPIALLPILILNINSVKEIKKEIASRQVN